MSAVRAASLVQFKDHPPQRLEGVERWAARGQNFVVEWLEARKDEATWEITSSFEAIVLLPDFGAAIELAGARIDVAARSICLLPPGRSTLRLGAGAKCTVLRSLAPGEAAGALNETAYAEPDPRIVPVGMRFAPTTAAARVRVFAIDALQAPKDNPRLKMLQSATMSINWVEYEGPRDRSKLSPHAHKDFEQGSLALAGNFVHHLRVPWGADADAWQEDRHARLGTPSLLVVPVDLVHTSEGVGAGRHLLVDVFSPPRADFIAKGWMLNAADYEAVLSAPP